MDIQTLSDSELEVMNAIWDKDAPVSVSELLKHFSETKGWKTTTIATFAVRLINKGFLSVEKRKNVKYYTPLISRERYDSGLARKFIDTAYNGSAMNLFVSLWDGKEITREEIDEIRRWIDELK
ncbi:MAG: BlaI/MecI/CopY family transcriptional regulator [Ruminiclostridium sp.]|nr:BlaI/MecI/CopY family transcriptional regulator [Ruminiclostridium sp.]